MAPAPLFFKEKKAWKMPASAVDLLNRGLDRHAPLLPDDPELWPEDRVQRDLAFVIANAEPTRRREFVQNLDPEERALVSAAAARRKQMDTAGVLSADANLVRARALLRAEAWRRTATESESHAARAPKRRVAKKGSGSELTQRDFGSMLDSAIAAVNPTVQPPSVDVGCSARRPPARCSPRRSSAPA